MVSHLLSARPLMAGSSAELCPTALRSSYITTEPLLQWISHINDKNNLRGRTVLSVYATYIQSKSTRIHIFMGPFLFSNRRTHKRKLIIILAQLRCVFSPWENNCVSRSCRKMIKNIHHYNSHCILSKTYWI